MRQETERVQPVVSVSATIISVIGVGTGGPGPPDFFVWGPNMTVAPTFEKCRPIFELKVTPYFQIGADFYIQAPGQTFHDDWLEP